LINLEELRLGTNKISDITPLVPLARLKILYLSNNEIKDLSALTPLVNLERLSLGRNQISDITPLLENGGLGDGDHLDLKNNNPDLSQNSEDIDVIRQLEDRGVQVDY